MHHRPLTKPSKLITEWILAILLGGVAPSVLADEAPVFRQVEMIDCALLLDEHAQTPADDFDPRRPTVVVVDGYSSGRLMAEALRRLKFQVVHVHSNGAPNKNFKHSFWPRTYERIIEYAGRLKALVKELKSINVVAVLPGTDTGVLLADVISNALHRDNARIRTNGIERARKNKFEMQERLKARGLDSIRQILTSDVEKGIAWVNKNGLLSEPGSHVVVKPLASAGGEDVYFLSTEKQIRDVFKKLLMKKDGLGNTNFELLIQEELVGPEYVLNSVIWNGRVLYTDIWQYFKESTETERSDRLGKPFQTIYDHDILLPSEGPLQNRLRAYDRKVLLALGIKHGTSHSEIKMVEGRGPVLIETNNRPMGSSLPGFVKFATGMSQIEAIALAVSDPKAFRALPSHYTIHKHPVVFSLKNLYDRKMRLNADVREKLRRLPGFFRDMIYVEPGSAVPPHGDLFKSIGEVWLLHEDQDLLLRTVAELHEMERNGELFSPL